MNDYRLKATKEEAVYLLIRTFSQFYYTFDNLNRRAINTSPETGIIVLIHNMLTDAFSLNRIRPNRNVELKIYEVFYDDLMELNDDEINELLQQCYELARKYNLFVEFELEDIISGDLYYENSSNIKKIKFASQYPKVALEIGSVESGSNNLSTRVVRIQWELPLNNEQRDGSSGNAFRHTLWQASITNNYGIDIAIAAGDAHESGSVQINDNMNYIYSTLSDADKQVDLLNNIIGRDIGNQINSNDIIEIAKAVLHYQYINGLYEVEKISENRYKIIKSKIAENVYIDGIARLNQLDENGYEK